MRVLEQKEIVQFSKLDQESEVVEVVQERPSSKIPRTDGVEDQFQLVGFNVEKGIVSTDGSLFPRMFRR